LGRWERFKTRGVKRTAGELGGGGKGVLAVSCQERVNSFLEGGKKKKKMPEARRKGGRDKKSC